MPFDRATYVSGIIDVAGRELASNPNADLHRCTSFNYSGGFRFWDENADSVYLVPENLQEALLSMELRAIVERAAENNLKKVEHKTIKDGFDRDIDLIELYRLYRLLAVRDPVSALRYRMRLAQICTNEYSHSLVDFVEGIALLRYLVGGQEFEPFV